ncbi:MAG: dihydropteroate synthase [Flavobacteriales bacterium]
MDRYTNPSKFTPFTMRVKDEIKSFQRPAVMGILNITPDSFYAGSRIANIDEAIARAMLMQQEGASIIDIGGQSTRPGSVRISSKEEMKRVLPVVEAIHTELPEMLISIDTYHSEVAAATLAAGAGIINDISAGSMDSKIFDVAVDFSAPYVLMHKQGTPETMQDEPQYADVTAELTKFFLNTTRQLIQRGINDIILDPGIGFGKTTDHNLTLLRELESLRPIGFPILTGVSRKRFIQQITQSDADGSLFGSTAMHALLLERGASILRVHDVKAAVDTVKVYCALNEVSDDESFLKQ